MKDTKLTKGDDMSYRHGETVLVRIERMPRGKTKKLKKYLVAHSESGRHHLLVAEKPFEVLEDETDIYLKVYERAFLKQDGRKTHNDLTVEPGTYKTYRATEYDPFQKVVRRVWD